jgi:hypothetical protein
MTFHNSGSLVRDVPQLATGLVCTSLVTLTARGSGTVYTYLYRLSKYIGTRNRVRGGTSQHGRSDQICSYSETVGPDWSGHAHLQLQVRTRGAEELIGVSIKVRIRT